MKKEIWSVCLMAGLLLMGIGALEDSGWLLLGGAVVLFGGLICTQEG